MLSFNDGRSQNSFMNDLERFSLLPEETDKPANAELPANKKGPLSFFSGATTSAVLAWLCFGLSRRAVSYFTVHSPSYSSAIAQSIASGLKTLVIGMCFLATFTFAFIGIGLTLVFIQSIFIGGRDSEA